MRQVPIRRPKDLGLAVAEARRLRRLSQAELADTAGIDRTYLVRLEAGLSTLLVERVLRLLRRLGAELIVVLPPEEPDPGERTS